MGYVGTVDNADIHSRAPPAIVVVSFPPWGVGGSCTLQINPTYLSI